MTNIDIKILNDYSKFINVKQVCLLSEVKYNTVKNKLRRFRSGIPTDLNETQSKQLSKALRKIGIKPKELENV
jgi:hypothetical protein